MMCVCVLVSLSVWAQGLNSGSQAWQQYSGSLSPPPRPNRYSHSIKHNAKLLFLIVNVVFRGVRKEGTLLGFAEFYQ